MTHDNDRLTRNYFLTAGECDAEGRMPLPLVAERIIEVSTAHANELGIGYATLVKHGIGWVLSRLSIEMVRYPGINEEYSLTTWIESINRRFSERNILITDANGAVAGYARSVWSAIDFARRTGADLAGTGIEHCPVAVIDCPIEKTPRIPAPDPNVVGKEYTFRYCDLDFNRHVNTIRYLELLMDQWTLEHYDAMETERVDLLFHHECRFGDTVSARICSPVDKMYDCELSREGVRVVGARFRFRNRQDVSQTAGSERPLSLR